MTSGFSVITSQRFGAHDTVGLKKSIAANILLNFISGIVITIIACLLTKPILISINTPEEIFKDSFNYIFWNILKHFFFSDIIFLITNYDTN